MRHIVLAVMTALLATACVGSSEDDEIRKPVEYGTGAAEQAPDIDVGTWSGKLGLLQSTLVLESDGSGYFCSSGPGDKESFWRVRYHAGLLLTNNGARFSIFDTGPDSMKIQGFDAMAGDYEMQRDTDLKLASATCARKLHGRR